MSGADDRETRCCPNCDSSALQIRGTNIRATRGGDQQLHYVCRQCGERTDDPPTRSLKRPTPDKPPHGFARKVWEYGERERAGEDR